MDSTDVPPAFGMCTKIGNSSPSFFDCKFKSYLDVSLAYVSGGYAPKRARESDLDREDDDDDAPKSPAIANVKPTAETTATMPFAAVFKFKEDDDVLVLLFVAFSSASSNGARS